MRWILQNLVLIMGLERRIQLESWLACQPHRGPLNNLDPRVIGIGENMGAWHKSCFETWKLQDPDERWEGLRYYHDG